MPEVQEVQVISRYMSILGHVMRLLLRGYRAVSFRTKRLEHRAGREAERSGFENALSAKETVGVQLQHDALGLAH